MDWTDYPVATMEEFGIDYTKRDPECVAASFRPLTPVEAQGCLRATRRNGWA